MNKKKTKKNSNRQINWKNLFATEKGRALLFFGFYAIFFFVVIILIRTSHNNMPKKEKEYKISFRSRNDYEISHFAEILGGGGHLNAAGATVYCSKNLAKQKAITVMKECIIETEAQF